MVEIMSAPTSTPVDTTTLGAQTALTVHDIITAPSTKNFMLKKLRTLAQVSIPDLTDALILVLATPDATPAEIATALATTEFDQEDRVESRMDQTRVRQVWDIQGIPKVGVVAGDTISWEIPWNLPPKGIPILRGGGLRIFAFNMEDASFSNGPTVGPFLSRFWGGYF